MVCLHEKAGVNDGQLLSVRFFVVGQVFGGHSVREGARGSDSAAFVAAALDPVAQRGRLGARSVEARRTRPRLLVARGNGNWPAVDDVLFVIILISKHGDSDFKKKIKPFSL